MIHHEFSLFRNVSEGKWGTQDFFSSPTLFSPNEIWLEDDSRPGARRFTPSPALAQNAMRFAGASAPSLAPNDQNLTYLTNINETHKDQAQFNKIDELNQTWGDTSRGLTEAGTAVVAVAAVAATVVTAGALAPVTAAAVAAGTATFAAGATFTVAVAVSSAATTTLSVSATNASMNAEGSLFNQVEDVSKTAAKDATSNEALKSYAIAGGTALLTFGMSQGIDAISNSANAANNANTARTVSTQLTLGDRAVNAIQNSLIQSVSSSR